MSVRWLALALLVQVGWASEWRTGQAARGVLGQRSFSARESGLNAIALSVSNGKLFVADSSRRLFSFDLSAPSDGDCGVCNATPTLVSDQSVPAATARFASYAQSVAIADPANRRVLLWRNSRNNVPDVILTDSGLGGEFNPVSVALDGHYLYIGDGANHRVLIWSVNAVTNGRPPQAILGDPSDSTAGAATLSSPSALVSDGSNLYVGDGPNHRILVFTPEYASLSAQQVLHSATLKPGSLAPGTLITIHGERLATAADNAVDDGSSALPTILAGQEVLVDGRAIPLISVSPSEIHAQLPYALTYSSSVSLLVRGAVNTNAVAVQLQPVAPGIFALAGDHDPRPGLLLHVDRPVTSDDPVKAGEVVIIWAAGLGAVAAPDDLQPRAGVPSTGEALPIRTPVQAQLNGEPLEVLSATLPPNALGIYEIRVRVPDHLPAGGRAQLQVIQDTAYSNTVTVPAIAN